MNTLFRIAVFTVFAVFTVLTACTKYDPKDFPNLKIDILDEGKGKEIVGPTDTLKVHYVGKFVDGRVFDSSYTKSQPKRFSMFSSTIIQGWKVGVTGMRVGGKRRLTIPPELAFGEKGRFNSIPPNTTLIFDIELLEIE